MSVTVLLRRGTLYCPDIFNLANMFGCADGQAVDLQGYYALGDGGNQPLIYRATGRSLLPAGIDGIWYFQGPLLDDYFEAAERDIIYVVRAGVNSSQTPSWNALRAQMCYDLIQQSAGGGIVDWGRQKIYIDTPILITGGNVTSRGAHNRGQDGGADWFNAPGVYVTGPGVDAFRVTPTVSNDTGYKFENLKIACETDLRTAETTEVGYGIRFQAPDFFSNVTMRDCEIFGFTDNVFFENTGSVFAGYGLGEISNCYFHGASHWGLRSDGVLNSLSIHQCSIRQNGRFDDLFTSPDYFGSFRIAVPDQAARLALSSIMYSPGVRILQNDTGVIWQYNGGGISNNANWTATAATPTYGGIRISRSASFRVEESDLEGQVTGLYADQCWALSVSGGYGEVCALGTVILEECHGFELTTVFSEFNPTNVDPPDPPQKNALVLFRCTDGTVRGNAGGVYSTGLESVKSWDLRYPKIFAGSCFDVDLPWEHVTPISSFDVTEAGYGWFADSPTRAQGAMVFPKSNLSFGGLSPTNGTWDDTAFWPGPKGQRLHVKILTATSASARMPFGHDEQIPISVAEAGDWACAYTWLYHRAGNAGFPLMEIFEGRNGAALSQLVVYESDSLPIPQDQWIIWRWVRKLTPADVTGSYCVQGRCYVTNMGDYLFMYGQGAGAFGTFPINPLPGNVNENQTTWIVTESSQHINGGGNIHLGEGPPTDGRFGQGEWIRFISPINGQIGMQCVTGGTPGVWTALGSNITTGQLEDAIANRSVNLGGFNLTLTNINTFTTSSLSATIGATNTAYIGTSDTGVSIDTGGVALFAPAIVLQNSAANPNDAPWLYFYEAAVSANSNYVRVGSPAEVNSNYSLIWAPDPPTVDSVPLVDSGTGQISWLDPTTLGGGGGTDTNITTGTVAAATADRTMNFATNDLTLDNMGTFITDSAITNISATTFFSMGTASTGITGDTAVIGINTPALVFQSSGAGAPTYLFWYEASAAGTNYVRLSSAATMPSNYTLELPPAAPSADVGLTSTHSMTINVDGTTYKIHLTAV